MSDQQQVAEPVYHIWTDQGYIRLTAFDVRIIVMYVTAYSAAMSDTLLFKLLHLWASVGLAPAATCDLSPEAIAKTREVLGYAADDLAEHDAIEEFSDIMVVWEKLNIQIGKKPLVMTKWQLLKEKPRGKKKRAPKA